MSLTALLDQAISESENARKLKQEALAKAQKEERDLQVWAAVTRYLTKLVSGDTEGLLLSVKDFTGAIMTLIGLGQLCGKNEMDLIRLAVMSTPELFHFAALRQYFRQTQDGEVGKLYLDRFLYPSDGIGQHGLVLAAKQALAIAAEAYSGNPEMLKKFALLVLERVPAEGAFHALLLSVSRSGILKEESFEIMTDVMSMEPAAGSKISDKKGVANMDAANRVQAMVLPGVTASLKDLASNNAAARAKANKKKNKAA